MKVLVLTSSVAFLAIAQNSASSAALDLTADRQEKTGAVFHLSGHAAIKNEGLLLKADALDLNEDTHEILAHGNVRVQMK
jgi:lipopolysaccharide assembly outer membrane protein LptD (OstA)